MRASTVARLLILLATCATMAGCGGGAIPEPPANAQFTPAPKVNEMLKEAKGATNKRAIMPGSLPGS